MSEKMPGRVFGSKTYEYRCLDKSILLPWFKKYYVSIFFKLVPAKLTANFITFISTAFVFFLLWPLVFMEGIPKNYLAALLAFCFHAYIVGDHLDGMQAKETQTGSALGEFLDHYLDVFNGAVTVLVCFKFFGNIPANIFFLFLWLNFVAFGATMMEELEKGELYFGPVGTLEGVIILIAFFISWLIPEIRQFWESDLYPGWPGYWILIGVVGAGYFLTALDIFIRLKYVPRQFLVFMLISHLLTYIFINHELSIIWGWLIMTLLAGEYIGKVMESYLLSKKHRYPDWFSTIGILLIFSAGYFELMTSDNLKWLLLVLTVYLTGRLLMIFYQVIYQLREHWRWVN